MHLRPRTIPWNSVGFSVALLGSLRASLLIGGV
ncbi:hypothetical protein ATL42_2373 [Sanguibacter antarcticus]|uniref:Uncharacterized protein n=1 Tax=Sanguibacter antarcticus TaxID=372484 RepID=A0A2A9E6J6_9MICO|nr:hypothetical protein ATL42_2373 [Sanguibacter antarcticus]